MAPKLDYRWNLRRVMAERGMFQTTDLIEPVAAASATTRKKKAVGSGESVGDLRPKRARIRGAAQP